MIQSGSLSGHGGLDLDLEAVEWPRQWLRQDGDEAP